MKRKTAEGLNKVILTYNKKLSDYVPKLRDELGTEDFKSFSDPVGHMLALSFDVLDLIWAEYPDLMPDEAKEGIKGPDNLGEKVTDLFYEIPRPVLRGA